jgi:NAD(P)-dependent dehydrogenase (short-subunit alcohol dehydrogenase family)
MGTGDHDQIELSVSDYGQIAALHEWLRSVPGVSVRRVVGTLEAGELGALDVLVAVAGSGGLVAVVRVIPEFLKARRSSITINATVNGENFSITASNVESVMPVLERALNER